MNDQLRHVMPIWTVQNFQGTPGTSYRSISNKGVFPLLCRVFLPKYSSLEMEEDPENFATVASSPCTCIRTQELDTHT